MVDGRLAGDGVRRPTDGGSDDEQYHEEHVLVAIRARLGHSSSFLVGGDEDYDPGQDQGQDEHPTDDGRITFANATGFHGTTFGIAWR